MNAGNSPPYCVSTRVLGGLWRTNMGAMARKNSGRCTTQCGRARPGGHENMPFDFPIPYSLLKKKFQEGMNHAKGFMRINQDGSARND